MEKIASFVIDHNKLLPGIYVSRVDEVGDDYVTTFDIRMKMPNREPVMDMPALHTMEHLAATYLRNDDEWKDQIVYMGPMGCRTGNYLLVKGKRESKDVVDLITRTFQFMADYQGDIPGGAAVECGNSLGHDLPMCRWESKKFLETLANLSAANLTYPS